MCSIKKGFVKHVTTLIEMNSLLQSANEYCKFHFYF